VRLCHPLRRAERELLLQTHRPGEAGDMPELRRRTRGVPPFRPTTRSEVREMPRPGSGEVARLLLVPRRLAEIARRD
jgi:hypothetical protein